MANSVLNSGFLWDSALVILGWTSYIVSFFVESSIAMLFVGVIARVLP